MCDESVVRVFEQLVGKVLYACRVGQSDHAALELWKVRVGAPRRDRQPLLVEKYQAQQSSQQTWLDEEYPSWHSALLDPPTSCTLVTISSARRFQLDSR